MTETVITLKARAERMEGALREIESQITNLPCSATASKIYEIARAATQQGGDSATPELEELVKAADLLCARLSFGALAEYKKWYEPELDAVRAALKPFKKEEWR